MSARLNHRSRNILSRASFIEPLEQRRLLTVFMVTNTDDNSGVDPAVGAGTGTLRQAIIDSNADTVAANTINFAIPASDPGFQSGFYDIQLAANLPAITATVSVDGTSQAGYSAANPAPVVEIGASSGTIFTVAADASEIQGLDLRGAQFVNQDYIKVTANNCTIAGNYIGFDLAGTANSVAANGLNILGDGNTIGGTTAAARNVIDVNGNGILLNGFSGTANNNLVEGNYIGVNPAGTTSAVSGGAAMGIFALTSSTGTASDNTIGGVVPGSGNLISGESIGIKLDASGNVMEGNILGLNVAGNAAIPNGTGISLEGTTTQHGNNNIVGGTTLAAGNVIANSLGAGVDIDDGNNPSNVAIGEVVRLNSIYNNAGGGIVLSGLGTPLGVTNDPGDGDTGSNNQQNYPALASAISSSAGTAVVGGLNSSPGELFFIDFYSDSSVSAQGRTYLGSTTVTTDVNGNANFATTVAPIVPAGQYVTATATTASALPYGDTSRFSAPVTALSTGGGTTPPPVLPTLSIGDISMNEGNSGTTAFTFTITRSGDLSGASSLQYTTADGTATVADGDYQPVTNTIGFDPNQATKTVTVLVNGDTKFESDETFTVNLSTPTGATIADAQATGTIVNDDPLPTISIGNVTMKEGNSGTTEFDFPLTFSDNGPFSQNISFTVTTADGTAKVSDNDYQPVSGAGAAFVSGTNLSGKFLPVFVNGDTKVEGDETFTVTISNVSGATIGNAVATGTILNDDSAPPPPPPASGTVSTITDPFDSSKKALDIVGTDNKDTITVTRSGSSQGKAVVKINGVNKGTFSFSGSIVVYGKDGSDNISIDSAITRSAYIWGGDGNDTVSGGGGNDVIFGQGNDDSLNGNAGRDILVGGDGTDKLNGGAGDDVLIAGDFKSAPSMSQIASIQKEWVRADKNYAARVKDLINGGGYNSTKLNSTTLFSSTTLKDSMTGGADSDLFFAAMTGDKITDKASGETAVNIG